MKKAGTITEDAMSDHIIIEALFAPDCGSRDATLLMINKLTQEPSMKVDLTETTIGSITEANTAKILNQSQ